MRLLTQTLLIVSSILFFSSCCTKMECTGADDLTQISFYGYANHELDTIHVFKFAKNSDFSSWVDSSTVIPQYTTTTDEYEKISFNETFDFNFDYKIELPSNQQIFTLTDFIIEVEKCNEGLLCSDEFQALKSYKVNGVKYSYSTLRID